MAARRSKAACVWVDPTPMALAAILPRPLQHLEVASVLLPLNGMSPRPTRSHSPSPTATTPSGLLLPRNCMCCRLSRSDSFSPISGPRGGSFCRKLALLAPLEPCGRLSTSSPPAPAIIKHVYQSHLVSQWLGLKLLLSRPLTTRSAHTQRHPLQLQFLILP